MIFKLLNLLRKIIITIFSIVSMPIMLSAFLFVGLFATNWEDEMERENFAELVKDIITFKFFLN